MKRFFILGTSFVLTLLLTGCGRQTTVEPEVEVEQSKITIEEVDDFTKIREDPVQKQKDLQFAIDHPVLPDPGTCEEGTHRRCIPYHCHTRKRGECGYSCGCSDPLDEILHVQYS